MAITLTGGQQQLRSGSWQSSETLTQSTATTPQALSVKHDVSILGMGTATGAAVRNLYTLGSGVEGQEKTIYCLATGEASVVAKWHAGRQPFFISSILNGGTATAVDTAWASATGQLVFQAADEFVRFRWMNEQWHFLELEGATAATTT